MNTGSRDEQQMLADIHRAANALTTIATCMQAEEARKRRLETGGWAPVKNGEEVMFLEGNCSYQNCANPVVAMIDFKRYCQEHIEVGFSQVGAAIAAAKAGFQYLEDAIQQEGS